MFSCLLVRNQVWAALVTKFPRRLINPKPWSNDPINPITPKSGKAIPKKRNVYLEREEGGGGPTGGWGATEERGWDATFVIPVHLSI